MSIPPILILIVYLYRTKILRLEISWVECLMRNGYKSSVLTDIRPAWLNGQFSGGPKQGHNDLM